MRALPRSVLCWPYSTRAGRFPKEKPMHRAGALLLLVALGGCNSMSLPEWPKPPPEGGVSASAWTRPGADAATIQSAYDDCLALTNTATRTDFDIDQDTAVTRSGDLQRSDFARLPTQDAQATDRVRAQTILASCMEEKGYSPVR
jgi:hypothetical protein